VSSNLFDMLGVRPADGSSPPRKTRQTPVERGLSATRPGSGATAAIRRRRARLELNGRPYQIVGVLPASFSLPHEVVPTLGNAADADIVIPLPMGPTAAQTRNREDYNIVGR
jgi:hypothetical protein